MYPVRTQKLPWREIDGRAVIVQPDSGQVHELNSVATKLWSLADGTRSVEDLVERLTHDFEVTPEEARIDAEAFFSSLSSRGLIRMESKPCGDPR